MSDLLRNIILLFILICVAALGFIAGDIYREQVKILAVLSGACL